MGITWESHGKQQLMSIMTFGSEEKKRQEWYITKVKLLLRNNGSQELQTLFIPLILVIPPVQFPPV